MRAWDSLRRIGTHLAKAAIAGVDVVLEHQTRTPKIIVVAGNNFAGKTTLLYCAKFGPAFNRKLLVPTVGHNMEVFDIQERNDLEVIDVGGGARMGPLFYKHVADANALLYVVRGNDPRFVSALWELYCLVRHACEHGELEHVHVLLCTDTSTAPEVARMMARLLEPDALPPTRAQWSHFFDIYNFHAETMDWADDRTWTETKRRTASHGMPLPPHAPPLLPGYKGSWTVQRAPPPHALLQEQAMQPFHDLHRRMVPPRKDTESTC